MKTRLLRQFGQEDINKTVITVEKPSVADPAPYKDQSITMSEGFASNLLLVIRGVDIKVLL